MLAKREQNAINVELRRRQFSNDLSVNRCSKDKDSFNIKFNLKCEDSRVTELIL